ncbi:hypothetical protein Trydic_g19215 [Trypoxylus dichotomus]
MTLITHVSNSLRKIEDYAGEGRYQIMKLQLVRDLDLSTRKDGMTKVSRQFSIRRSIMSWLLDLHVGKITFTPILISNGTFEYSNRYDVGECVRSDW